MTVKGSLNIPVTGSVRESEWSVVAAEGKVIHVDLSGLGLRPTADGRNYVELRNGQHNNSIMLAKFNGTGPANFTTIVPDVYIVLHSEDPLGRNAVIHVRDETWTGMLTVLTKLLCIKTLSVHVCHDCPLHHAVQNSQYALGESTFRLVKQKCLAVSSFQCSIITPNQANSFLWASQDTG